MNRIPKLTIKARPLILELLARYSNKGWILDENAIKKYKKKYIK